MILISLKLLCFMLSSLSLFSLHAPSLSLPFPSLILSHTLSYTLSHTSSFYRSLISVCVFVFNVPHKTPQMCFSVSLFLMIHLLPLRPYTSALLQCPLGKAKCRFSAQHSRQRAHRSWLHVPSACLSTACRARQNALAEALAVKKAGAFN